jgi:hypothetical protein
VRSPSLRSLDERGKHRLQTQVQRLLAASAVALATPHSEDDTACYWGTDLETSTILYLRLASDPAPKALRLNRALLHDCGAGRYPRQQQATTFIRRTLKKMGILPA